MLDYDLEAPVYDATRGGVERAEAAAAAVEALLPDATAVLLDVACGTGIVSTRLRAPGRLVVGVDRSAGMLALAAPRLDGHVVQGDAANLPVAPASVDAVTFMWLLHLVPVEVVEAAVAEAARVLRPGGVLVTTVDKNAAPYVSPSDVADLIAPVYRAVVPTPTDAREVVTAVGARFGLTWRAESGYVGHGQGRSARRWAEDLRGEFRWTRELADPTAIAELCDRLAALPDQDTPRPDPVYRVAALVRE